MWQPALFAVALLLLALGCRSHQVSLIDTSHINAPSIESSSILTNPVETTTESGRIEEYVQLGLARNPSIQAARHRMDAIRCRVPQVMALPDPMVNTNTFLSPVQTASGEQVFSLGISQKFTNQQKRATQAAIVSDEWAAAEAELELTQLEIAEKIRSACYQLLLVRKSIDITEEDRQSLEQIANIVLRQYEVKKAVTLQDVLNVQSEQSAVENQLTELRQKEKSLQARLARLLHVDPRSELNIVDRLETVSADLDYDQLIGQAFQSRPDLKSQLANLRRDRKKTHLAHLEDRPEFTVGLNWIATSSDGISPVANGDDALLLGIGFNLPVSQSRIRAGISEAQSNRLASEQRLESLKDQASEEVFDHVAKLESVRETLALIQEDIIPKAERTLEVSIEQYSTDSVTFIQLIANWRNTLKYRIAEANLQSQYQQLMASLAKSVGQLAPFEMGGGSGVIDQPELEDFSGEVEEVVPEPEK